MKRKHLYIATTVSGIYFVLVMLVLFWYEWSLGLHTEYGGMISGHMLVLVTLPSVMFADMATQAFGCARYSRCEHIVGAVFSGGLNSIILFLLVLGGVSGFLRVNHDES
jgi:hypothetical protein